MIINNKEIDNRLNTLIRRNDFLEKENIINSSNLTELWDESTNNFKSLSIQNE